MVPPASAVDEQIGGLVDRWCATVATYSRFGSSSRRGPRVSGLTGERPDDNVRSTSMDRVQRWTVRGDMANLAQTIEANCNSNSHVIRVGWDATGGTFIALTERGLAVGARKLTVQVENRTADHWDLFVCSEMRQLLDYGINRRQLVRLRRAVESAGFVVEAGPLKTSWRRSTRPRGKLPE